MLKIVFFIVISASISVIGCNSENGNQVNFAAKECLTLGKGYQNARPITQEDIDEYEACCYVDNSGLMLNRVIKKEGKNNIFIALSSTTIPQDIEKNQQQDSTLAILNKKEFSDKGKYFYSYLVKKNKQYINRQIYTEPDTDLLIIFDVLNGDSAKAQTYYNDQQQFIQKISCE